MYVCMYVCIYIYIYIYIYIIYIYISTISLAWFQLSPCFTNVFDKHIIGLTSRGECRYDERAINHAVNTSEGNHTIGFQLNAVAHPGGCAYTLTMRLNMPQGGFTSIEPLLTRLNMGRDVHNRLS
jgi:hypothetical protein